MSVNIRRREFIKAGSLTLFFTISPLVSSRANADGLLKVSQSLHDNPQLNSWVKIHADGSVSIFTGKVEIGQGIRTALMQIAADELDVPLNSVSVAQTDTASSPREGDTSRSHSIIESGGALRAAAAEMRAILLARAADKLDVRLEDLIVTDGVISKRNDTNGIGYGELVEGSDLGINASGNVAAKDPSLYRYVGKAVKRIDIPAKVTGKVSYVHDLRLQGMVHGRICRPPSDHSDVKLTVYKPEAAERLPGVIKIVRNGNFVGVIAEREEQAIAAAETLKEGLEWDLPSFPQEGSLSEQIMLTQTTDKILREDADVDVSLEKAHYRAEGTFTVPFQSHASIGPSCAVAHFDDGDGLTIWTHTQSVYGIRSDISQLINHPEDKLRVIHMEGAGCYGQNGADDVALDAVLLAREAGTRPVRVQWMRSEEFASSPKGPAMVVQVRAGSDADGNIVAWDHEYWSGPHVARYGGDGKSVALAGLYIAEPAPAAAFFVPGAASDLVARAIAADDRMYAYPNKRVIQHALPQFSPLRTAELRGVGAFTQAFAEQAIYDDLSAQANIDPIEFRLRFVQDQRMRKVLETVADMSNWQNHEKVPGAGRGCSFFYYDKPFARSAAVADITVDPPTGEIRVKTIHVAVDVGLVVNPDGFLNQIEGGVIQSVSRTLKEEVVFEGHEIKSLDWVDYPILNFNEIPEIKVKFIDRPGERAGGAGETQTPIIPSAIANAVFDATRVRLYQLPFTPERVKAALG